ncbi:recombinase family protein [Edwardsiella piscicida]
MKNLMALISELHERGACFRSLTDSIDTSTAMWRFFFHVISALAEMEREPIVERTRAGLTVARERSYTQRTIGHPHVGLSTLYRHYLQQRDKRHI